MVQELQKVSVSSPFNWEDADELKTLTAQEKYENELHRARVPKVPEYPSPLLFDIQDLSEVWRSADRDNRAPLVTKKIGNIASDLHLGLTEERKAVIHVQVNPGKYVDKLWSLYGPGHTQRDRYSNFQFHHPGGKLNWNLEWQIRHFVDNDLRMYENYVAWDDGVWQHEHHEPPKRIAGGFPNFHRDDNSFVFRSHDTVEKDDYGAFFDHVDKGLRLFQLYMTELYAINKRELPLTIVALGKPLYPDSPKTLWERVKK